MNIGVLPEELKYNFLYLKNIIERMFIRKVINERISKMVS
jgi:hypothetical protein